MGPPRSSPSPPHTLRTRTESSAAAERCVLPGSARRCSVDPGWVYEDAVAAVWAIGADGDQLEAVVSGFERPGYTADRRCQGARSRGACARTAPRSRARARPESP